MLLFEMIIRLEARRTHFASEGATAGSSSTLSGTRTPLPQRSGSPRPALPPTQWSTCALDVTRYPKATRDTLRAVFPQKRLMALMEHDRPFERPTPTELFGEPSSNGREVDQVMMPK